MPQSQGRHSGGWEEEGGGEEEVRGGGGEGEVPAEEATHDRPEAEVTARDQEVAEALAAPERSHEERGGGV